MSEGTSLRRAPVQDRSAQRVDRIIEACAEAFDEVGYDGLTTTLLAERADMSVGGLYRFFESKQAVVAELRSRRLALFVERAAKIVTDATGDWTELAASLIDLAAELRRTVPGFGVLQLPPQVAGLPIDPFEDTKTSGALAEAFAARQGTEVDPQFRRAVLVAFVIGDSLTTQAFRLDPAGDDAMLTHAKAIVSAYLRGDVIDWRAVPPVPPT